MKYLNLIISLSLLTLTLVACNTVEGLGEDIQKGGEKIENAAKKTK